MTDKENNPDANGLPDATMLQSKTSLHTNLEPEPPAFHCPVCEGTGSLMPDNQWEPEICWSCMAEAA